MAMFGAGTMPAMLIVGYFGRLAGLPLRNAFKKSTPWFMALIGVALILRGLSLDIPFVSPVMPEASAAAIICH
jgi:sulfite exporter TauE/SafE